MTEKNITELMREEKHDFQSLVEIMRLLRSENGCPWDMEQTHESIRANFIEETYEVVEAIDNRDAVLLREELGDVLLQVVFHARISQEEGDFDIEDVIHDICAKLIRRHPHIFADVIADTTEEVLSNWEKIKTEEKHRVGLSGTLTAVPPSLPSLMRMQKIVKKAAKESMAPTAEDAAQILAAASVSAAEDVAHSEREALSKDLKKVLVSAAVIAQENQLDAEELLYDVCRHVTRTVEESEHTCGDGFTELKEPERGDVISKAFFNE